MIWFRRLAVEGYGLFDHRHEWSFKPGLNIISGANEAGKSTLQRAILTALYANPFSTARELKEQVAWNHSTGWQIELELEEGGERVVLWKFYPVDNRSGSPRVRLLIGQHDYEDKEALQHWENRWQLPKAVYLATACVCQRELHFLLEPKGLEALRQALHTSALAVDLKGVYRQLEDKHKELTRKSTGALSRLDERIELLSQQLQEAQTHLERRALNRSRIEELQLQQVQLQTQLQQKQELLNAWQTAQALQEQLEELKQQEVQLSQRLQQLDRLNYRLELLHAELSSYESLGRLPEDFPEQCARLQERWERIAEALRSNEAEQASLRAQQAQEITRRRISKGLLLVGCAFLVAAFPLTPLAPSLPWFVLALGIALLLGGILLHSRASTSAFALATLRSQQEALHRERESTLNQMATWLQQAGLESPARASAGQEWSPARIEAGLESLLNRWRKYRQLVQEMEAILGERQGVIAGEKVEEWHHRLKELASKRRALEKEQEQPLMQAVLKESPLRFLTLQKEIEALISRLEAVKQECYRLQGQYEASERTEDPEAIRLELEHLIQQRAYLQQKADLYLLTHQLLEQAESEFIQSLQTHLAPLLESYLVQLTGGRYQEVQVESDLSLKVYHPGCGQWLPAEPEKIAWSAGTVDQLFFAARLGFLQLFSGQNRLPLLLDDPFVHYDRDRLQKVVEILTLLSRETQVLLFTCREIPLPPSAHLILL